MVHTVLTGEAMIVLGVEIRNEAYDGKVNAFRPYGDDMYASFMDRRLCYTTRYLVAGPREKKTPYCGYS